MTQTDGHLDRREVSTGELVGQLSEQVSRLVRSELRLAQVELRTKGKRLGLGAGMAGVAAVLAWFMVGALVCAAIAALALVLPVWASALIVAGALGLLAGVLGLVGKKQVTEGTPPIPEQAIAGAQRDIETIKGSVHR
jgi:Flp pilus assembly protein TadB